MIKKLLTIILSILLCIGVMPNKAVYANSINIINLEDTIPADLGDFYGKPYEKMNEGICMGIKYASISGIDPNAVDITITPSGDLETLFMERQPYTVLISLSCLEDYFFESDNDFYMNIIKPTPSQVIVNDNQNSIGITYTYNEEGFLDNSGGGSTTESISEIDLSFILNIPQYNFFINRKPSYFFGTLGTVEFDNMTFLGCQVYNQTDGFVMTDNNDFENGDSWVVSLFYEANEGYNFDSIDINNISPKPTAIKTGVYTYNAQGSKVEYSENNKAIQLMYYIYNTSNPNLIHSIDLSELDIGNFNNMTAGDVIELINNFNFSQFHMSLINHIEIPSVLIERTSPGKYKELENDDVFEKGEQYALSILLKADEGYSFPYVTAFNHDYAGSFTIGGKSSELFVKVGDCVNEFIDLGSVQYRNGLCIECVFSDDDTPIKNINLNNAIPTNFSQYEDLKASELISDSNSWDFGELINKGAVCFKESGNNFVLMNSTESFALGKEYELVLYLQAPEGKIFDSEYSEDLDGYIYKGQFSPTGIGTIEVGEITLSSGNININTSKDSDSYTNPKNGIKVVVPFTVGEEVEVVEISTWDELEEALYVDPYSYDPPAQTLAFKLTGDLTAGDSDSTFFIHNSFDVRIDLNGHVINRNLVNNVGMAMYCNSDKGSVFHVEGKLKLTDSSPNTPHEGYVNKMNGVWHLGSAELSPDFEGMTESKTIYGGIITGGKGFNNSWFNQTYGGGIYIDSARSSTSVTMNGCTICGNVADSYGGGVALNANADQTQAVDRAKFIMNGGTICNNCAPGRSEYEGFGGGIYVRDGYVTIKDGHVDENVANEKAGGIFKDSFSIVTITSGTINNNKAKMTGAIYNFDGGNNYLNLKATPGKEIVITGNKSEQKGNVCSSETHISGKVIIKNNTSSDPARVCSYTGRLYYKNWDGQYPTNGHIDGESPYFFDIVYLDGFYYPNDFLISDAEDGFGCQQKIYVEGDLTGSDINLSTAGFYEFDHTLQKFSEIKSETIINYRKYNPEAKIDDYIHHAGPSIYHFELNNTNGSIYVATTQAKETNSNNFKEAIDEAIEEYIEYEGSKIKIDLTGDIGDKDNPFDDNDGLYIPPNVELDLNGHDIFIGDSDGDGEGDTVIIEGDLTDSGGDKGKLYLDDPNKLIYDHEEETDDDGGTGFEPVWTATGGDDNLEGYYCVYRIGANTKWDKTKEGKEWTQPGDDAAKFKVQPTAYSDLSTLLEDYGLVYGENTKVRAGLRLNLYKKGSNNPYVYYFAFSEGLTNSWAKHDTEKKCMSVCISGLAPYEKVEAQAAIFSKPNNTKISIPQENARFFSSTNVAGSGN